PFKGFGCFSEVDTTVELTYNDNCSWIGTFDACGDTIRVIASTTLAGAWTVTIDSACFVGGVGTFYNVTITEESCNHPDYGHPWWDGYIELDSSIVSGCACCEGGDGGFATFPVTTT